MVTRQQIVDEARTWLGTPFHHQARNKGIGADCIGVVGMTGVSLGLLKAEDIPKDYAHSPNAAMMQKKLEEHLYKIPVSDAKIGDVLHLVFDIEPQHVAIITDIGLIHAYAQVRKCVEHSFDAVWQSRVRGAYRFKGIV